MCGLHVTLRHRRPPLLLDWFNNSLDILYGLPLTGLVALCLFPILSNGRAIC